MGRRGRNLIWLGLIGILLTACGMSREARHEDKVEADFKAALSERQVERRRQTAESCRRQGETLPASYEQKGGGMLEEFVSSRPPCGITAQERISRAEADFRASWQSVIGTPVPLGYEWLLEVKRRIAVWLDTGGLTPTDSRTVLREAQWILAQTEEPQAVSATVGSDAPAGAKEQYFVALNTALNRALAEQGVTCRHQGEGRPCI